MLPTAQEPEKEAEEPLTQASTSTSFKSPRHTAIYNALFDYLPDALIDMIHGYSQDLCAFAVGGRVGPLFASQVTYIPIDISQCPPHSITVNSLSHSPTPSVINGLPVSASDSLWRFLPSLQLERVGCTSICYGNCLYAIGGRTYEGISASCEVFNFQCPSLGWEFIADLNIARMNSASTIYEEVKGIGAGKIILAGGLGHRGPEQSCEIYDIYAGKWLIHLIPVNRYTQVDQLHVDHGSGNLIAIGRALEDGLVSVETFPLQRLQQNSRRLTRSSRLRAFSNTAPINGEPGELQWSVIPRTNIHLNEPAAQRIPTCLRIYRVSVPMSVDNDGRDGNVIEQVEEPKATSENSEASAPPLESKEEKQVENEKKTTIKVRTEEVLVEWHDEKFCLRSSTRGHTVAQYYEAQDYLQISITGDSANTTQPTSTAAAVATSTGPSRRSSAHLAGPPSRAALFARDSLNSFSTSSWCLPLLPNGRLFCGTALGVVEMWE